MQAESPLLSRMPKKSVRTTPFVFSRTVVLVAIAGAWVAGAACGTGITGGADPSLSAYYSVKLANNQSLPFFVWRGVLGNAEFLDSARLSPFDVGRTEDVRLINDRGGNSGSGQSRDTATVRGKLIDVRFYSSYTDAGAFLGRGYDTTVVDVVRRDTLFMVVRPHPDPTRSRIDTGYFQDNRLILPTRLTRANGSDPIVILQYQLVR